MVDILSKSTQTILDKKNRTKKSVGELNAW